MRAWVAMSRCLRVCNQIYRINIILSHHAPRNRDIFFDFSRQTGDNPTLLEVDLHKEVSSIAPIGVGLATEAATAFATHIATENAFSVAENAVRDVATAFA